MQRLLLRLSASCRTYQSTNTQSLHIPALQAALQYALLYKAGFVPKADRTSNIKPAQSAAQDHQQSVITVSMFNYAARLSEASAVCMQGQRGWCGAPSPHVQFNTDMPAPAQGNHEFLSVDAGCAVKVRLQRTMLRHRTQKRKHTQYNMCSNC